MNHHNSDVHQSNLPARDFFFPVERLDVFRAAVDVAQGVRRLALPPRDRSLYDQLIRAADSCLLNLAEGSTAPKFSAVRRNHYRIALGSACEACAALYVVDSDEARRLQHLLGRIGAMLTAMSR
jgi:four helix bundle protein